MMDGMPDWVRDYTVDEAVVIDWQRYCQLERELTRLRAIEATGWAEQATRSAARSAELEAERDELARIQDEAEWVMDVTLTALHCIAGERYDGPAWHCNCHWCGGPDRAHHRDCPTVIARQALRESLKKDGAERIAELEHELRVAQRMAIVQRVIAEQGGEHDR
jgi:hypothetical protein